MISHLHIARHIRNMYKKYIKLYIYLYIYNLCYWCSTGITNKGKDSDVCALPSLVFRSWLLLHWNEKGLGDCFPKIIKMSSTCVYNIEEIWKDETKYFDVHDSVSMYIYIYINSFSLLITDWLKKLCLWKLVRGGFPNYRMLKIVCE